MDDKARLYNGTLQEFAKDILASGRGNGRVFSPGRLHPLIEQDLAEKGESLISRDIVVTQKQIFKYRNHPKILKGAALPLHQYDLITRTIQAPTRIFEDTSKKSLAYVYIMPYNDLKVVKVVVQPNYRKHDAICNLAKSWGLVDGIDMLGKQYRELNKQGPR